MLTDILIEFDRNSCILTEILTKFDQNQSLSTDILTANWSKFRACGRNFDRNGFGFLTDLGQNIIGQKLPGRVSKKFASLILTEFVGQNPNFGQNPDFH